MVSGPLNRIGLSASGGVGATRPKNGHWPGYFTPNVVAWVFDVGIGRSDWRVRVRKRGGWRAFGFC